MPEFHGTRRSLMKAIGASAGLGGLAVGSSAASARPECDERMFEAFQRKYGKDTARQLCEWRQDIMKQYPDDPEAGLDELERRILWFMPTSKAAWEIREKNQDQAWDARRRVDDPEVSDIEYVAEANRPGSKIDMQYQEKQARGWGPLAAGDMTINVPRGRLRSYVRMYATGMRIKRARFYGTLWDLQEYVGEDVRICAYYNNDTFCLEGGLKWSIWHREARRPETEQTLKIEGFGGTGGNYGDRAKCAQTYIPAGSTRHRVGMEIETKVTSWLGTMQYADAYTDQFDGSKRHVDLTDGIYIERI